MNERMAILALVLSRISCCGIVDCGETLLLPPEHKTQLVY